MPSQSTLGDYRGCDWGATQYEGSHRPIVFHWECFILGPSCEEENE